MSPRIDRKIFPLLLALSLFCPGSARALTLTEAVQRRLDQAPQVPAQRQLYDLSSQERIRRFIPNEPQFTYANTDSNTEQSFGFQQPLGFPGKSIALAKVDKANVQKQHSELSAVQYDLTKETVEDFLECAGASATYEIQKGEVNYFQILVDYIRSRYEAGIATAAEWIGAKLQERQESFEMKSNQDKAEVGCEHLAKLLNLAPEQASGFELPDDLDPSVIAQFQGETADENRAEGNIAVAKATLRTAWWNQLPDLGFSYARNHYSFLPGSPNGQPWTTTYGVGVNIPIFFGGQERIDAQKAKSQAILDQSNSEVSLLRARSDRAAAAGEYRRDLARLEELRKKDLPLAEVAMDSAFSSYKAGKLGFAELILARKNLTDLKIQDIQLRSSIVLNHLRCLDACQTDQPMTKTEITYAIPKHS